MTDAKRERLPDERNGGTHGFRLKSTREGVACMKCGHVEQPAPETVRFYFTVNTYPDGRPGEVFVRADKQGTLASGALDVLGIIISLALQHGVPLKTIVAKMKDTRFPPASFTGDELVPNCSSPLDLLARYLEAKFLPKGD